MEMRAGDFVLSSSFLRSFLTNCAIVGIDSPYVNFLFLIFYRVCNGALSPYLPHIRYSAQTLNLRKDTIISNYKHRALSTDSGRALNKFHNKLKIELKKEPGFSGSFLFILFASVIFEGTEGCRLCSSSPVQELFVQVQLPVSAVLPAVELH